MVHSQSLTGVITPVKTPALKRIGQSISVTSLTSPVALPAVSLSARTCSVALSHSQRSISFRNEAKPLPPAHLRQRPKASSFPRRRNSQCWSDTVESHDLTVKEIKRQEVRGEGMGGGGVCCQTVVIGLVGHPASLRFSTASRMT